MSRPGKTSPLALRISEDRLKVLELRRKGLTYREVSKELGLSLSYTYRIMVQEMQRLARERTENAEGLRALEERRLDKMLHSIADKIEAGDLKAIETALKIQDRRAKLRGLDAPTETKTMLAFGGLTDQELAEQARRAGIHVPEEIEHEPTGESGGDTRDVSPAGKDTERPGWDIKDVEIVERAPRGDGDVLHRDGDGG